MDLFISHVDQSGSDLIESPERLLNIGSEKINKNCRCVFVAQIRIPFAPSPHSNHKVASKPGPPRLSPETAGRGAKRRAHRTTAPLGFEPRY